MESNKKIAKHIFAEFLGETLEKSYPGKLDEIFESIWGKLNTLEDGYDIFVLLILGDSIPEVGYEELQEAINTAPDLSREDLGVPSTYNAKEAILLTLMSFEKSLNKSEEHPYVAYASKALNFCIPF